MTPPPTLRCAALLALAFTACATDDETARDDATGRRDAAADVPRDAAADVPRDALSDAPAEASPGDAPVPNVVDAARDTNALDAALDVMPDVAVVGPDASVWTTGSLGDPLPSRSELRALPGGGEGGPVVTSNNPEVFRGDGVLYGTARAATLRGGATYPLRGDFGVYLHHLNRSGARRWVTLMVTNPGTAPVTVQARGSGYNQSETGGLGLGSSPDYRVSDEWIHDRPGTVVPPTALAPLRPMAVWSNAVPDGAEVDGRFGLRTDGPVFVYVVVTSTGELNDAITVSRTDAPGDIARSGTPPPPFGREAGVYAHDTWRGTIAVDVPVAGRRVGYMVNTATGGGMTPVQAFPALTRYDDSAQEAVGMYGNVYDLTVALRHDGDGAAARRVRVSFASYAQGAASRYWDGVGTVDGGDVVLRHTPTSRVTTLAEVTLPAGGARSLRFRAMVPGLAAIPQALWIESL